MFELQVEDYDYFVCIPSRIRYNEHKFGLFNIFVPWLGLSLDIFNNKLYVLEFPDGHIYPFSAYPRWPLM